MTSLAKVLSFCKKGLYLLNTPAREHTVKHYSSPDNVEYTVPCHGKLTLELFVLCKRKY